MKKCIITTLVMFGLAAVSMGQTYEVRVVEEKPIDPYANYVERMRQINEESAKRRRMQTQENFMNESLDIQRERLRLEEERMRYIKYGY